MDSIFLPPPLRTAVDQSTMAASSRHVRLSVASQMNEMNEIEGGRRSARVLRRFGRFALDLGERVSERVLTRNVERFALGN